MPVVIDYGAIESKVSAELIEKIRCDIKQINESPSISNIQKFMVNDSDHYTVIGFCTIGLIYIYRYDKHHNDFSRKILSIADYLFIEEMMEGGS